MEHGKLRMSSKSQKAGGSFLSISTSSATMSCMTARVRAIVKRGEALLLVRHKDPQTGKPCGYWSLPGGHIENGEMMIDALVREMIEETGIKPVVGRLLYVYQFWRDGAFDVPEFIFSVEDSDGYSAIDLSSTTHGSQEIAEIGFYDPRTLDNVLPGFLTQIDMIDPNAETKLIIHGRDA